MNRYAAAYYDLVHGGREKDYAVEAGKVDAAIRAHGRPNPDTLLDVACGTGQHLLFLRNRYRVEGLDADAGMLEIARRRLSGVTLHHGDMLTFDLGRRFDAVICLFSAIGHVRTRANLRRAVARMAAHLAPGGVLVIEPWIRPEDWRGERGIHGEMVDRPDVKVARLSLNTRRGRVTRLEMHYLAATLDGVRHVVERLTLGLFTHAEYVDAFERAGLRVHHDPAGLTGRGLYVGVAPA